jgi:maltose O-acetyltransferase
MKSSASTVDAKRRTLRDFLREKLVGASWAELLWSQFELFVFWLVGGIPGLPGFALRSLIYKALFARLEGFCWIQPGVKIARAKRLTVGRHFACNSGSYIGASGGVAIGDYVLIGPNVTITSAIHPIDGPLPVFVRPVIPKAVTIEDDVWIAAGAAILPGVTLRKGTVVGANSVVTRDTEEYGVYVGAPAKLIRSRIGVEGDLEVLPPL